MKQILERTSDKIFPSAQELWDRMNPEMRPWNGTEVPFFDLELSEPKLLDEKEFVTKKRKRRLGRELLYQIDVNGVDHLSRVFDPYDEASFTITSGAAFTTTINGYAHDRARKLFADTQQPHIQTSAPHGANELGWRDFMRVPETYREAKLASLALAAQTEQMIVHELSRKHDLPLVQVPIGDSRDSITIPGQYPYAAMLGAQIIDFDAKARCALERMGIKDGPRVLDWTAKTILGGIGVGICLAKEGELDTLWGSTSFNPNFVMSSMTGTLRGLASEEPRLMMDWAPHDARGIDIPYGNDSLVDVDDIREAWQGHPNIFIKDVSNGNHASLLHPLAHSSLRGRMKRRVSEYEASGHDSQRMDWNAIYGVSPDIWQPGKGYTQVA